MDAFLKLNQFWAAPTDEQHAADMRAGGGGGWAKASEEGVGRPSKPVAAPLLTPSRASSNKRSI